MVNALLPAMPSTNYGSIQIIRIVIALGMLTVEPLVMASACAVRAPPRSKGAGYATVSFTRQLTEKSTVVVRYRLEAESRVIHLEYDVDWQDQEKLLKSVFPTAYNGHMARFGAPFGSALRPQQGGDDRAEAMWEVPGSRWACLADDGEGAGMAVITEAKYGFSARNGSIGLSLFAQR